tara:strand:- start:704 stop:1105 length:402 start_codon:yes stop_codon:yes gene_type:complete
MIILNTNTALQTFYVTPFQRKKDFTTTITNYLFVVESLLTDKKYYFVADVQQDNERYTEVRISTNTNTGTNNILITESGQYSYIIFGQTNSSNLDPNNAVVVGELERGLITFTGEDAWTMPSIDIPDNVVYYE